MRSDEDESSEVVEGNTYFIPPVVDISSDEKSEDRMSVSPLSSSTSSIDLASVMSDELSDTDSEIEPPSDGEKCKCMQAICNVSLFLVHSEFVENRHFMTCSGKCANIGFVLGNQKAVDVNPR